MYSRIFFVLFFAALCPSVVLAAPRTFDELMAQFMNLLNAGIGAAIILGLVIYFYGIASSLTSVSSEGIGKLRTHLLWGLLALFLMVSVWGILALVRNTLFGGGGGAGIGGGGDSGGCTGPIDCLAE